MALFFIVKMGPVDSVKIISCFLNWTLSHNNSMIMRGFDIFMVEDNTDSVNKAGFIYFSDNVLV